MKNSMIGRLAVVVLFTLAWSLGCGGVSDENLSVKADADSDKLQRAQAELDAAAAKSKAVEAARTRGRIKVEQ